MSEPNQPNQPSGRIVDPKTGLPFGQIPKGQTPMVQIQVPVNQSSVVIPVAELQALKGMSRIERRRWAARKKKLMNSIIDDYVRRAVMANNGKPEPKTEEKEPLLSEE